MGISHAALWNAMLSTELSNQQLWSTPFCLSRVLQRKMSRCTVPDRQVQPALLGISMSQLEADLRLSKIQKVEVLRHLETLPTVPAMSHGDIGRPSADLVIWLNVINATEHSSLPSLPTPFAKWLLLSSQCRMEIAPGFSPWGLAMPHCGTSCL